MKVNHQFKEGADVYFSADVETDGPIPGPFSILSFALVFARCFDIKTAIAVKGHMPVSKASRPNLFPFLRSSHKHTHHALDDAAEQAEIFANVFEWEGSRGRAT